MVMGVNKRAVGVFSNRRDAEGALYELRESGFPIDKVSVIKRDADRNDEIAGTEVRENIGNKSDEGATVGAVSGGVLGGLTGLLVGLGTLAIPGIGPIMLAGATATALATTAAGAGIGAAAGSLLGALVGLGIPEERARVYNERVQRGDYLIIIDATDAEIARAEEILKRRGIEEFDVYDRSGVTNGTAEYVSPATGLSPAPRGGLGQNKHAVGYFSHLRDAEAAVSDLRTAGFPLSQISLFNRDSTRREPFAGVDFRDRIDATRFRFPDARTHFYNERLNNGDYVVVINGTDDEINSAGTILNRHGIEQWEIHDPALISSTQPVGIGTATLQRTRRAIGVFPHLRDAEAALTELRDAGIPLSQVSLIAKDTNGTSNIAGVNTNLGTGNKADDGAKAGAATGGALGGLGGLLVGLGALTIPGVGPIIAGGAAATALATTLAGGAIGAAAGGLAGGLVGLGIPENRARVYSDRVNRGDNLVIVDGTDDQIHRAEPILKRRGIEEFDIFDAADTHGVHPQGYDRGVDPRVSTAPLQRTRRAIGVFPHRRDAEAALTELRDTGFPLSQVSLIAKDTDAKSNIAGVNTNLETGNKADEGAKAGAATGGALGGLGGLLVGLGALAIPGVGPVIAGGAAATALATTLAGGAIGAAAGGLAGGLVGLGIPENRARVYGDRVNRGDNLVMVDGTNDEIHRAEPILKRRGIEEFDVFDATDIDGVDHQGYNRGVRQQTPVVNTPSTNYSTGYHENDPAVIIVDHRTETA